MRTNKCATFALKSLCISLGLACAGMSFAAGINVGEGEDKVVDNGLNVESGEELSNAGNLTVKGDLVGNNGFLKNTGTLVADNINWFGHKSDQSTVGGTIKTGTFTYKGINGNNTRTFNGTIEADLFNVIGTQHQVIINIENSDVLRNVTETRITADGERTRLSVNGDVDFTNSVVLETKSGEAAGIEIKDGKHGSFSRIKVVGEGKLQVNDTAQLTVGLLKVEDGASASLQAYGEKNTGKEEATYTLGNVILGEKSALKAVYYDSKFPTLHIAGDMNVQMASGSIVDFAGKSKDDWRSDKIIIDAPKMTFTLTDLADPGKVYLTETGTDLTKTTVNVVASSEANTGDAKDDLKTLSGVVSLYDSQTAKETMAEGVKLEVEANDIFDGASAVVGEGGSLTDVVVVENDNVHGLAETAALGLHMWRNEMNDVGKRLGDVRASKGLEKAAWARMYTGKATFGGRGIENKYTAVQVGYDQAVAPECRIGAAFSYTDGSNDFATGGGDNSIAALTVYGSWFDEKGSFLDVSGKFGRLDNEFSAALSDGVSRADYNADAWSFTVETGHRFDVYEMMFIEPQFELMYGRVESVDYTTSTGVAVEHDSAETLVGRAGVVMGFKCPSDKGNVYVRASVLHDWKGEADYAFSKNGHKRALSEDLGGTWYEYGVGANLKFSDALYGYADVEAADGGEVDTDYRVNLGVRYAF